MSGGGNIIDFGNSVQLEKKVAILLDNPKLCRKFQIMVFIKWHQQRLNSAGCILNYSKIFAEKLKLNYRTPKINLNHFKALTGPFAMIQFSIINQPDLNGGYAR
jgi:hypothetical protein